MLLVGLVLVGVGIPVAVAAEPRPGEQRVTFVDVPSLSERPESQRPRPDLVSIAAQVTAAKARRSARSDWRATPGQREARRASRRAFKGLGPANALRIGREQQAGVVSAPVWRPLQLRQGERIGGYLNDHTMQIDVKGASSDALAYSLDPVLARDEQGRKRPVDLSLERRSTGFSPANSPVDVRLPERLEDGIRLESLGISVRPQLTAGASSGSEVGGKVFYANVAPDTDFMGAPVPSGVETFHVLRSQASPESLPLLFDLPAGARLRVAPTSTPQQRPVALEVVRGDDVIATVSKPTAFDADGESVPVEAELEGADHVALHVAHRDADVKYPIVVDPVVGDSVQDDYNWRGGSPAFAGWNFGSAPYNYFVGAAGNGTAGNGLYIYAFPNGAYSSGQYAQWAAFAPGSSYIYRAEFGYVNHVPSNSQVYEGIYSVTQGRWEESYTTAGSLSNNWRTSCVAGCAWAGTPGNAMVIGMLMTGRTGSYGTFGAAVYMGQAMMMLHDDDYPTITLAHSGLPSGWTNQATIRMTVNSADPGLGVRAVGILSDTAQFAGVVDALVCGDHYFRCPNTASIPFTYTTADGDDGVHTIAALARDAINHTTTSSPWTLKIDTTEPAANVDGPLRAMEGRELSEDVYKLTIDTLDEHQSDQAAARAGVKSIEVKLDGARVFYDEQAEQPCPGAGCAMKRDWEFRPFDQDLPVGDHTLQAVVTDYAGNQHVEPAWKVRTARGAMTSPRRGDISERRFKLRAAAKRPGYSTATFVYRRASTDPWTTIPAAELKTTAGDSVSGTSQTLTSGATPTLVWDAAATLQADTPVQIRAHFDADPAAPSTTVTAAYKPNGLGADYAREDLGPGSVDLLTGNFILTEDDASIDSYASDLTIRRTYASRMPRPAAGQPAGAFGPGWLASAPVQAAGADYVKLDDATSSVTLMLADTTTVQFAATASGYDPQAGYEELKLTKTTSPATFTLTDTSGDTTLFKPIQGNEYRPTEASNPGNQTTTNYEYSVVGGEVRLARVLAPRPAGITSCEPLVAGCRELRFTYATSTTASGTSQSQLGDYAGRLVSVTFGSGADGGTSDTVARYQYDSEGRLRTEWDPRIAPALKTGYDYDTSGLLVKVTPPGEQPWTMTYQAIALDPAAGRLRTVSRVGPSGTATRTAIYDVPLSGTGAPYAMGASDVARWAQTDAPVDATAIFRPDQVPGSGTPSSYSRATVHYLNGSGRKVNTALPGGHISSSEYDEHHNIVRALTAANRQRALAATDTAARARELDTVSTYDATGLELREELEPRHEIRRADGSSVQARKHTLTTYDTGGLHLPTLVRAGARVDGQAADSEVRTTSYEYDTVGKAQRKPTSTITDPDGLKLTTRVAYDSGTGLEVSRTLPAGAGSDARTTRTIYYSAAPNADEPSCGAKPAWANLVCKTKPAAQPTGSLPAIPTTTREYNRLSQPTTIVDVAGSVTRTTANSYDAAGRQLTEATTATSGTALPTVTRGYSTTTGRQTTVSTQGPAKTITRVFDSLGRQTSHTDAEGVTSTTTYDLLDRPVTINDGKATQTLTYDSSRGLLASVTDPQVGTLDATYDADGEVATKTYPNGLTATLTTDETGERTKLRYVKASKCGTTCEWLLSQAAVNVHGQQTWQSTTSQAGAMSTDDNTYDAAGRLKQVNDRVGSSAACTVRAYGYDADSNRERLQTFAPGAGGACQITTPSSTQNNTYDEADRLTNTGFDYDAFGRTLTVPAASAGGAQLTSTYYVNDLAKSLSQDGTTRAYTLDPAMRVSTRNTTTGSGATTETYHYSDTVDNGLDSPTWIAENAAATLYTRMVVGPDGALDAIRDSAGTRLQLTNLHDDVIAEASPSAAGTQLTVLGDTDPFGVPRQQSARRQGWLGGKRRSTELKRGVVAMGVRTYVPDLGRFLQTDPVQGGSFNDYDYAFQDPVNVTDLNGECPICRALPSIARAVGRGGRAAVRGGRAALRKGRDAARSVAQRAVDNPVTRPLFARGTGLLNRNPHVRIGFGWNGFKGREVFRISIGDQRGRSPLPRRHIDLFDRR